MSYHRYQRVIVQNGKPFCTCASNFLAMLRMYFYLSHSHATLTKSLCRLPMSVQRHFPSCLSEQPFEFFISDFYHEVARVGSV